MKTLWALGIMGVCASATAAYGQTRGLTSGSDEAARALRQYQQGSTSSRQKPKGDNPLKEYLPSEPRDWFVGDIGQLGQNGKVVQVIDDNRILIHVTGDSNHGRTVMVSGDSTKQWSDGDTYSLQAPVEITKTVTYKNAGGSTTTVLLLECNSKRIKEIGDEITAKEEAEEKALQKAKDKKAATDRADKVRRQAAEEAKYRIWTTSDGTKTEARYNWMIKGEVTLTNRKGSKLKIPLDDLCAEDREWITNHK